MGYDGQTRGTLGSDFDVPEIEVDVDVDFDFDDLDLDIDLPGDRPTCRRIGRTCLRTALKSACGSVSPTRSFIEGDATSYTAVAEHTGATYFDMGDAGWDRGTKGFGLSAEDMFEFFNRPVLDAAVMDGKTIRFTHDPNARRSSFLFREARYLEQFGYNIVPDGNGMWIASP